MRKILLGLALLASASVEAQQTYMPANAPTAGHIVTLSDGTRVLVQDVVPVDPTTGAAAAAATSTNGQTASGTGTVVMGRSSDNVNRTLLTTTRGVLAAPTAGVAESTGTVTAIAATTSTTVCPATTNPVVYEVQIYGTGPVLLGLDGQLLTAITPAAGTGAYMLLPTQYTLYAGPVARTNAITAYTATAQTIVCNIVTRQ